MSLTKVTYSMIDSAPANVKDFGAVGDGSADDWAAFNSAFAASNQIFIPSGTYYLDIDANGTLTSASWKIITGEIGAKIVTKNTTTGRYILSVGGDFGNRAPEIRNIEFENYIDATQTQLSYVWDAAASSAGTSYGPSYDSTNRENGLYLGKTSGGIIGIILDNVRVRGVSGTAVTIGSGTNHLVTNSELRDNRISLNFENTDAGGYNHTNCLVLNNFIHRNLYGIANIDNTGSANGHVSGLMIENNALDDCSYPVYLIQNGAAYNNYVQTKGNWIEDNEFNGTVVTQGPFSSFNDININGVIAPNATLTGNILSYTFDAGAMTVTNANGAAFAIRGDGIQTAEFKDATRLRAEGQIGFQTTLSSYDFLLYDNDDAIRFGPDGTLSLGTAAFQVDDLFIVNAPTVSSDERIKQDIEELSEAEVRVATALKGLVRKYRLKTSVEKKGDSARTHFGVIAQDVKAAFEAEGLDPFKYAILCHDQWEAEHDEDGNETLAAGDKYAIRYEQLLAFIISAI